MNARIWYYDWLLTSSDTAAEIRLFDLGGHFLSAWSFLRTRLRTERLQLARKQRLAETGAAVMALIVTVCALGWMVLAGCTGHYHAWGASAFLSSAQSGANADAFAAG
jgi:ATP-binding cassette subfamily B protein